MGRRRGRLRDQSGLGSPIDDAAVKGNVGRYLFTSSTGVYYPYLRRGLDETAPVRLEIDDPKDESAQVWCREGDV